MDLMLMFGLNEAIDQLMYLHAETRQEANWVINAKPTYCRYLQALVLCMWLRNID